MIQGLSVPQEVYDVVSTHIRLQDPTRLLQKKIRDVLAAHGLSHDANYILDHLRGYHIEPLDFILCTQVMAAYEDLYQGIGPELQSFPYSYLLQKIMTELGYGHLVQSLRIATDRKADLDARWTALTGMP